MEWSCEKSYSKRRVDCSLGYWYHVARDPCNIWNLTRHTTRHKRSSNVIYVFVGVLPYFHKVCLQKFRIFLKYVHTKKYNFFYIFCCCDTMWDLLGIYYARWIKRFTWSCCVVLNVHASWTPHHPAIYIYTCQSAQQRPETWDANLNVTRDVDLRRKFPAIYRQQTRFAGTTAKLCLQS